MTERSATVGVVIPAYNEALMVGSVVEAVCRLGLPVIVVDDESTDDTARKAEEAGAMVISMPFRAGAWGAAQTGLRHALRLGWKRVITMDADGQHQASSLPHLLHNTAQEDVIIGTCTRRASRLRLVAWGIFRTLSGLYVQDITSGLRVYNRRAVQLMLSSKGIMADYQDVAILLLLQASGLRIREIPVPMRLRKDGKSRIFCSWWRVTVYMICTTLLSSARRCPVRHPRSVS